MEIGKKLKAARANVKLTQEMVAEEIQVSRQTISNWENEKSYPDIISVIKLSELYQVSLDELLKGDRNMMKHLEESTDVVMSNKKLLLAIGVNCLFLILVIVLNGVIERNTYLILCCAIISVGSISVLFYQIIKKF